jgi:hypothetical protein
VCMPVALVIQRATRMRRITLSHIVCLARLYFSHYLINGKIFKKLEHEMCDSISLQLLPEIFLTLKKITEIFV